MTLEMRCFNAINCLWTVQILNFTTFIGCIAECNPPGTRDILITISPDRFIYNLYDVVNLVCPTGYQLVGPRRVFCNPEGSWHRDTTITSCRGSCSLDYLENEVEVTVKDEKLMSRSVHSGDVAYFSCDGIIIGNPVSTCYDQSWSPEIPSCLASSCGRPVSTNSVVLVFPDSPGSEYENGTDVKFSCPTGYDLQGDVESLCLYGVWDFTQEPTCQALPCTPLTQNDPSIIVSPNLTTYESGLEIRYSCPTSHVVNGTVFTFCELGNWKSPDTPECVSCNSSVQCALNSTRLDRDVLCTEEPHGNTDPPCYGHWSKFLSCKCRDPDYRLIHSNYVYWCSDQNGFDEMLYSLECRAPCSVGLNENVIATNSAGIETVIIQDGDYVQYSCPDGYMENGPATVACSDGTWMISQPFSCIGKLILRLHVSGSLFLLQKMVKCSHVK
ncbi:Complement factor H-related protein 5 [Holothuria leucospilota]|uniref:Complement factor H-related protein 5 n=1 Tax=Holothuria leucospilota TaxID=206669 RepID=A0A9Q0YS90_HOLLE|nr:Complement factor H-related protein 5 [Holothuria leucospilota]